MRAFPCALLAALLAASVLATPSALAGRVADQISQLDQEAGERVGEIEALFAPANSITSAIPENPQQALIDATSGLSADLGFPQDPTAEIRLAQLPDEVAGRLANVLTVMRDCNSITQAHFEAILPNLEEVAAGGGGLDPVRFSDVRACALRLWSATNELELALAESRNHPTTLESILDPCESGHDHDPEPDKPTPLERALMDARDAALSVDVWPVLRLDGQCASNTYSNDYLLIADIGGDDVYANNAGSNMVDLNYAPASSGVSGVRGFGPARGCQQAIAGLRQGDCVPAVAAVLDLRGYDEYGVLQSPDLDARCTPATTQLIRRMVTGGVGFLGVGILRDAGDADDNYTSKTVSLGAGHIFGVGLLSDGGGNDSYLSVRNSQGFALVGGVGILADRAGNDTYDFYMPPAITPGLDNQIDGAGGVLDDEPRQDPPIDFEGLCDRIPRFTQGIGNVTPASIGILLDLAGSDSYRGAFGTFAAPGQIPPVEGDKAGSLGFGANGGIGIFADLGGGFDTYTTVGYPEEAALRANATMLTPGQDATGNGGVGIFADR